MPPALELVVSCYLRVQFCTGGCEDRTWECEAEESTLLAVVDRKRPMKTHQAEKGLSGCCGDW
jgi:hypothetical protein